MNSLDFEQIEEDRTLGEIEEEQAMFYHKMADAKKTLKFYEDQYLIALETIERRKKILLWNVEICTPIAALLVLIAMIMWFTNPIFSFLTVILLLGCATFITVHVLRSLWSWRIHVEKSVSKKLVYTLNAEREDKRKELERVRADMKKLDHLLAYRKQRYYWLPDEEAQPVELSEGDYSEEARKLLSEIAPELEFKDEQATHLYGELLRIS